MKQSRKDKSRVTIQAVAAKAGVSPMTVSNVFNRKGKVGEETRRRVLAVIDEMGYVPSQAARHLVGAAPARIGILYHDTSSMFINAALAAVTIAASQRGLQLLMREAGSFEPERIFESASALVRSGADGLLLLPPFAEVLAHCAQFAALGVPAAAIATARALPGMSTVRIDNRAAAQAVTSLLIANGRQRIGVVTGPVAHSDSRARLEGYKAALAAHGLPFVPELCAEGRFTFGSGLRAADALLSLPEPPDAIAAGNDDMAAAVLLAAHRRGLVLPRDLAVCGFDDTLIATRVWPALTTVRQPIADMTSQAIDALVEALRDPRARGSDLVLDFTLVERESIAGAKAE